MFGTVSAAEERNPEDLQGFPHGMPTTEAETINSDLLALAFIRG
jgi:hypothetical protein